MGWLGFGCDRFLGCANLLDIRVDPLQTAGLGHGLQGIHGQYKSRLDQYRRWLGRRCGRLNHRCRSGSWRRSRSWRSHDFGNWLSNFNDCVDGRLKRCNRGRFDHHAGDRLFDRSLNFKRRFSSNGFGNGFNRCLKLHISWRIAALTAGAIASTTAWTTAIAAAVFSTFGSRCFAGWCNAWQILIAFVASLGCFSGHFACFGRSAVIAVTTTTTAAAAGLGTP